ncbi:hypothetical protein HaLaN_13179, partial [Haematococcus lacustris]
MRTKAEQAAKPTKPTKGKGKAQGKSAKAKPAPQAGRWLDRDCNAALNMQRIGESSQGSNIETGPEQSSGKNKVNEAEAQLVQQVVL